MRLLLWLLSLSALAPALHAQATIYVPNAHVEAIPVEQIDEEDLPVRGVATVAALNCAGPKGRVMSALPPSAYLTGPETDCLRWLRAWGEARDVRWSRSLPVRHLAGHLGIGRLVPATFENACRAKAHIADAHVWA